MGCYILLADCVEQTYTIVIYHCVYHCSNKMKTSVCLAIMQFICIVTYSEACNNSIVVTDAVTLLTSPGYPQPYENNVNCWWRIQASSDDKLVGIVVTLLALESSTGCIYDSLSFYDGKNTSSPLLDRRCVINKEPIVSSGPDMYLNFVTDRSYTFDGFQLKIFQVQKCGGDLIATSETRYIASPGYPHTYFNNLSCIWKIKAANESDIIWAGALRYTMHLQQAIPIPPCFNDVLTFYSGNGTDQQDSQLLGRFCGSVDLTVLSSKNEMLVVLHTDSTVTEVGFNLSYKAEQVLGLKDIRMTASSFPTEIYSPGYPDAYFMNFSFIILIELWTLNIRLEVIDLDIEGPYPECPMDSLTIYRDNDPLETLCGNTSNGRVFHLNSTFMYLNFTTDDNTVGRGYHLRLTAVDLPLHSPCGKPYLLATSSPQYLHSPGYPTQYNTKEDCTWTIAASHTDMNVRIVVLDADFEGGNQTSCPKDFVSVYDGSTTLRHIWCSVPRNGMQSNGNIMTLHLHTGGLFHGHRGFNLTYFETAEPICGGTMNASNTEKSLTSPNYPAAYDNNVTCTWKVYAPRNTTIKLTMAHFDINTKAGRCYYESVIIYDGTGNAPSSVGELCGSTPADYISSENSMTIKFTSGSMAPKSGFDFRVTAGNYHACTQRPVPKTATVGGHNLSSPNYPFNYPNNADCTWLIDTGDSEYVVQIYRGYISLEYADSCELDYVEAFDGEDDSASSLGRWCHGDYDHFKSTGQFMFLKFKSDPRKHKGTFKIEYSHLSQTDDSKLAFLPFVLTAVFVVIVITIISITCYIRNRKRSDGGTNELEKQPPQVATKTFALQL